MYDPESRERLELLVNMLRRISQDPDPVSSIIHYAESMRSLYGDQALISISLRNVDPGQYRVMRILHQHDVDVRGLLDLPFAGPNAPAHSGGLIGEIITTEMPVVMRNLHIENDPALGNQLAPYRVLVAVPVFDNGVALNWVLFLSVHPDAFLPQEVENRVLQTNLMAGMTNTKIAAQELRTATEWIHREVDVIAVIQRGLLPQEMPTIPGLQLAAFHRTFDRAGGDFYDVFPVGKIEEDGERHCNRWGIFIADVSGHGAAAAVIVAMMSTLLESLAGQGCTPGRFMRMLNQRIAAKAINGNFVTAFMLVYDVDQRECCYACAGHNLPLVRRADGRVEAIPPTDGIPLGVAMDADYEDVPFNLGIGETLVLYTDGITEARSPQDALFGEAALMDTLSRSGSRPEEIIRAVSDRLAAHERALPQADDQALLAIHRVE
ncbi:MAG: serine/threonine-protein phosphatase [Candidatus Hydrogenedentes bacterium]|nr:serine/threonine-protein phosphatase [Candidatus Hydrogenedentota bacterium]